jgi:hypothetical protein
VKFPQSFPVGSWMIERKYYFTLRVSLAYRTNSETQYRNNSIDRDTLARVIDLFL